MKRFLFIILIWANTAKGQNDDLAYKANNGDANSQFSLALKYFFGKDGFPKDYLIAFDWGIKAAQQGHFKAQYFVGSCYDLGKGTTQDYTKAVEWYTLSANQGYANAMKSLAVCYDNGLGVIKNKKEAFNWYLKSAKNGNAVAQYKLANIFLNGSKYVRKDSLEAYYWLFNSAIGGKEFGHVEERITEAKTHLTKFANNNTSNWRHYAKYYLGKIYTLEGNELEAKKILNESFQMGCKDASIELGRIYYKPEGAIRINTSADINLRNKNEDNANKKFNNEAKHWFHVALDCGLDDNIMIYWYLCNIYTNEYDFKNAANNLQTFISKAHHLNLSIEIEEHLRLADLYYLLGINAKDAFKIYKERYEATKKQDINSIYFNEQWFSWMACGLGKCYYKGFGIQRNHKKAFELFKEAVTKNDSEAMFLLSQCYRFGRGTAKNQKLAEEWLKKSKNTKDPNAVRVSSALERYYDTPKHSTKHSY